MGLLNILQERVRVIATKLENSIADMKRDGYTVAKAMLKLITFSDVSNMHWNTLLRQQTFLKVGIIPSIVIQSTSVTVTPVTVTILHSDRFFSPKKHLLLVKIIG